MADKPNKKRTQNISVPSIEVVALGQKARTNRAVSKPDPSKPNNPIGRRPSNDVFSALHGGESLLKAFEESEKTNNFSSVESIVEDSLNVIARNPFDFDKQYFVSVVYCAKRRPVLFCKGRLYESILTFLRVEGGINTNKRSYISCYLACNVLYYAWKNKSEWPTEFIQAYIEDALQDRLWCDDLNLITREFVTNILTGFPSLPKTEHHLHNVEEEEISTLMGNSDIGVQNRYPVEFVRDRIKVYVLDIIQRNLRNQQMENSRNLLKVLTITSTFKEVRLKASECIEEWLNNPSTLRFAKSVLSSIVFCCRDNTQEDILTLSNILKIKLKVMYVQIHLDAITQVLKNNINYPVIALRNLVYSEILPHKANINTKLLQIIFKAIPKNGDKELGLIIQELTLNESIRPVLRPTIKRLIKSFGHEIDYVDIASGLLFADNIDSNMDDPAKLSWISTVIDVICYLQILALPSVLYEPSSIAGPNINSNAMLLDTRRVIAKIQCEAVKWFHIICSKFIGITSNPILTQLLRKLLFLESSTSVYFTYSEVSVEAEKTIVKLLTSNVPVYEDTITRIVLMSLTKLLPLSTPEVLDVLEILINRAAHADVNNKSTSNNPTLLIENSQLIEAILKLSWYQPASIYEDAMHQQQFPQFAVSVWFWQACLLVIILVSYNPQKLGSLVSGITTIKCMIEMCITKSWKFPPVVPNESHLMEEDIMANEYRQQQYEKQQILKLENMLAHVTTNGSNSKVIEESNSILLPQLITFPINGSARLVPQSIIRKLEALDTELLLGRKLCTSRTPDYLLDIMNRQGAHQSLSWLVSIIESEVDTLDALPLNCLSQLLLQLFQQSSTKQFTYLPKLYSHIIFSMISDITLITETLQYLLSKLISPVRREREASKKSLHLILLYYLTLQSNPSVTQDLQFFSFIITTFDNSSDSSNWIAYFELMPQFGQLKPIILPFLIKALYTETEISYIESYIQFLYKSVAEVELLEQLTSELSKFILNRTMLVKELVQYQSTLELILRIHLKYLSTLPTSLSALKGKDLQNIIRIKTSSNTLTVYINSQIYASIVELLSWINLEYPLEGNSYKLYEDIVQTIFQDGEIAMSNLYDEPLNTMTLPQATRLLFSHKLQLVQQASRQLPFEQIAQVFYSLGLRGDSIALPILLECMLSKLESTEFPINLVKKLLLACEVYLQQSSVPKLQALKDYLMHKYPVINGVKSSDLNTDISKPIITPAATSLPNVSIEDALIGIFSNSTSMQSYDRLVYNLTQRNQITELVHSLSKLIQQNKLNMNAIASSPYFASVMNLIVSSNAPKTDVNNILQTILSWKDTKSFPSTLFELKRHVPLDLFRDILQNIVVENIPFDLMEAQMEYIQLKESYISTLKSIQKYVPSKTSTELYSPTAAMVLDWLGVFISSESNYYSTDHPLFILLDSNPDIISQALKCLLAKNNHGFQRRFIEATLATENTRIPNLNILKILDSYLSIANICTDISKKRLNLIGASVRNILNLISQEYSQNQSILPNRIGLLFKIVSEGAISLDSVLLWLQENSDLDFSNKLLLQLYFELQLNSDREQLFSTIEYDNTKDNYSRTNNLLHHLVISLLSRDHVVSSSSYNLMRRLSQEHPVIILSCLNNILVLLKGRVTVSISEFIERQYFEIFLYSLGILDTLRPSIYKYPIVNDFIAVYFDLLSNLSQNNQHFTDFIDRFIQFMSYYAVEKEATPLEKHIPQLKRLSKLYPNMQKINVLTEIILVGNKHAVDKSIYEHSLVTEDITTIHNNLNTATKSPYVILSTLIELEKIAINMPTLLTLFIDDFINIIEHNPSCEIFVSQVVKIIAKYLHFSPNCTKQNLNRLFSLLMKDNNFTALPSLQDYLGTKSKIFSLKILTF